MTIPADIIARFEGQRAPRYTSYPTAPHFTDRIADADYRRLLAGLPADTTLSLYLHVPFCRSMCWYCGCHTRIVPDNAPIQSYLGALQAEIQMVASALPRRMNVSHVHWGAGTPTIVAPGAFRDLTGILRDRFKVAPDAEVAVEIDPRRVSDAMVHALGDSGVTRASLACNRSIPRCRKPSTASRASNRRRMRRISCAQPASAPSIST